MKLCTNCKHGCPVPNPERAADNVRLGLNPDVARCTKKVPVIFQPWLTKRMVTHKENTQAEQCGCYERREG